MIEPSAIDQAIFEKLKNDDEKSFELLFKKYYASLCRFAFSFTKNRDDSEEVVQEVFVNIWNNRQKINIKTSFKSYLFTSVRNYSLNYLNKAAKQRTENIEDVNYYATTEDTDDEESRSSINMEQKIHEAIESLPEKCKEIFSLSKLKNMKNKEVAEHLNISIKTVENQMTIALKKLREDLGPYLQHLTLLFFF